MAEYTAGAQAGYPHFKASPSSQMDAIDTILIGRGVTPAAIAEVLMSTAGFMRRATSKNSRRIARFMARRPPMG